ncbi:MAG: CDP-diacylglycerol--glycerol-3-phosphate 3-phosphatidyltransferase [Akkermansia sp.]|nr:CDP-diacylglycerol--glycerol-3-phosphate 3-phosphatidyltransferase [Akkermansia sp.]
MLNLPNSITLVRILLVLVFTIVLAIGDITPIHGESSIDSLPTQGYFIPISIAGCIALWAFVVGAISDFLDGYLARKLNLVTNFGKLIDPLADKILVCSAFVYLTYVGMCPFWVTIVILFREFLVTGLRQVAATQNFVIAADWCGKWKTGIQLAYCIACLVYLAYGPNLFEPLHSLSVGTIAAYFRETLMWGSVILTLWSGMNYCIQGRHFLLK